MSPKQAHVEEYPMEIMDLSQDFKHSKTFDLTLDEDHKCHRFWVYLKCMKWQIEFRSNSFECFAAYFKTPSTWSAEVDFEIRAYITNSVRMDHFAGRFTGANHVHFRPLKLHEHMMREKLTSMRVEITMSVTYLQNFGMIHDYFDMLPAGEDTLLKVEGKLIRVSKRYLALMSPFFKALFYGELGNNQEVYELPQEKYREILTFLRCIYPHRQPVTSRF
uniref:BTB domain-containing protein n=1 Tax=Caenorhabditis japonica TaxID=281687 RepID=A0A8R1IP98_CAEJA